MVPSALQAADPDEEMIRNKNNSKPLNFNGYADFQGFVHFLYVKQEMDYINTVFSMDSEVCVQFMCNF